MGPKKNDHCSCLATPSHGLACTPSVTAASGLPRASFRNTWVRLITLPCPSITPPPPQEVVRPREVFRGEGKLSGGLVGSKLSPPLSFVFPINAPLGSCQGGSYQGVLSDRNCHPRSGQGFVSDRTHRNCPVRISQGEV